MESSTQALASYGEALGIIVVAAALLDWTLSDAQRHRIATVAIDLRAWAAAARRRWLVDKLDRGRMPQACLAAVFLGETLLFWFYAHRMGYRGQSGLPADVAIGYALLFVAPLAIVGLAVLAAGPRLIGWLTGSKSLLACAAKCLGVALVADLAGYGALRAMGATFVVFGPRALIDWWDVRLWIYAAEYAVSGVVVSAMAIAHVLLAVFAAGLVTSLLLALVLLEADVLARVIRRYPRQPLLGTSIALAGLAIIVKDWV